MTIEIKCGRNYTSLMDWMNWFSDSSGSELCTFSSRTYSVGDIWYSRLGQRGALYCVACLCQEVWKFIWIIIRSIYHSKDCESLIYRAARSTVQSTSADKNALRRRPRTNAVFFAPVSLFHSQLLISFFFFIECALLLDGAFF